MTHKRTIAILALAAFTFGVGISFVNLSNDPSASASEAIKDDSINEFTDGTILEQEGITEPDSAAPDSDSLAAQEAEPEDLPTTTSGEAVITSDMKRADIAAILNSPEITKVTVMGDVSLNGTVNVTRPISAPAVTLDLNGHTLDRPATKGYAFTVKEGNMVVTGQGTISGDSGIEIDGAASDNGDQVNLTIDQSVTIVGRRIYGIVIMTPNDDVNVAYGVNLVLKGAIEAAHGISIHGSVQNTTNIPNITIADGASISASGAAGSTAIYAAGNGNWNIGAAEINAASGINIRAGQFVFNDTTINVNGAMRDPVTGSGGIDSVGAAFQIEHHTSYADNISLNINSGNYVSENGDVFYEYGNITPARSATAPADININGGTFTAGTDHSIFGGTIEDIDIEIKAGTFRGVDANDEAFKDYFVGNLKFDQSGNVVAAQPITPSRPSNPNVSSPASPVEDPSKVPEAPSTEESTPDTGINQARGKLSAINTVAPVAVGAVCIIAMVLGKKLFSRLKSLRIAEVDCEIATEVAEAIEDEPEPVIERFVATKIDRDDPIPTMVDTFISFK